ncbi:Crp/Fnr family transcriptional regulator [Polynucleobacter sp. AP-Reno-20A-A9]|uniref:Crp/Fnr family transcriptional regulator n=1 Tax=Polynucleobacter sp. AP-Reno-20A-A9 TaxID=2576925 RepID=UPI001C0E7058|nr:Crp/Fnr family transcriptional regulator [Polynucleobacter sp. AP-Reno-20A-A9]MBU3629267.1 Crp/Fnr family transcriptional regulator [Polynucleobacter sp. AP-Reno-20A-A9]
MSKNFLIDLLPKKTQGILLSEAELYELNHSEIICIANEPIGHLYFPIDGCISIVQSIDDHPPLGIGVIGNEGMVGAEITLGASVHSFGMLVQCAGSAWKIKSKDFLAEIKNTPELSHIINHYLAVHMIQLGLTAACEHFHEIGPRLAKWLLMSQDRAQSPTFFMTHEFISLMMGVRRVGITTSAADFKRRGLIDYHRGEITILNRFALKAEACSCYQRNREICSPLIH